MNNHAQERFDPLDLLTINQVAELGKIHHQTVRKHIREGRLKTVTLGGSKRIPRDEAERYLLGDYQPVP